MAICNMKGDLLFLLCLINCSFCNTSPLFSYREDICQRLCDSSGLSTTNGINTGRICQRGCRLFNIVYYKSDGADNLKIMNGTLHSCKSACFEAYPDLNNLFACRVGCTEMFKTTREAYQSTGWMIYMERDGERQIILIQPELDDPVEANWLLNDPVIRPFQASHPYRLPATSVRTMPIAAISVNDGFTASWMCASRWIFVLSLLLLFIVFIWRSKRSTEEILNDSGKDQEIDKNGPIEDKVEVKCQFPNEFSVTMPPVSKGMFQCIAPPPSYDQTMNT